MPRPRGRGRRARSGGPTRGRSSFSPCLLFRWCRLVHAVEVALERIDTIGPERTELIQPVINLLEWLWLQAIETALCVHRGFHETGLAQHAQVLGDRGLRHPQPALDLSHRLLGQDQEAQDRAAVRLRDDGERRFHGLSILSRAYTCQGIYGATAQGVIAFLAPWGCGSRRAFSVTVTVLALIASAAHAGLSRIPSDGYSTPAASGMAIRL